MGGGEIDKAINKGLSKLAPNKVVKLDTQKNKKKQNQEMKVQVMHLIM